MKDYKFYHIMFLPLFGEVSGEVLLNLLTIAIFFGVYAWHLKHDHKHNKELLSEVKKIREKIEGK